MYIFNICNYLNKYDINFLLIYKKKFKFNFNEGKIEKNILIQLLYD